MIKCSKEVGKNEIDLWYTLNLCAFLKQTIKLAVSSKNCCYFFSSLKSISVNSSVFRLFYQTNFPKFGQIRIVDFWLLPAHVSEIVVKMTIFLYIFGIGETMLYRLHAFPFYKKHSYEKQHIKFFNHKKPWPIEFLNGDHRKLGK